MKGFFWPGTSAGIFLLIVPLAVSPSANAQVTQRAQNSSSQRAAILNTLRPRAVRDLGQRVEFVVHQYRQVGNLGFVAVTAQRPGGRPINLARTPIGKNGASEQMDGPTIQAFFTRTNGIWGIDLYAIGATDLWYMDPLICATYATVMTSRLCPSNVMPK